MQKNYSLNKTIKNMVLFGAFSLITIVSFAQQVGIDWYAANAGSTHDWSSVTYGAGKFVAVSSNGGSDAVMTSIDGEN